MTTLTLNDYKQYDVVYDGNDRPLNVVYWLDDAKTVELMQFNMTYDAAGNPFYKSNTLYNHSFNVSNATFELTSNTIPIIDSFDFTPTAPGITTVGVHEYNIPWATETGINLGTLVVEGGTEPFVFSIDEDTDNKFTTVDEFLQLDNALNIFEDILHTVVVRVTDTNGKTLTLLLTFNVVSGTFTNTNSLEFDAGKSLIGSAPAYAATTQFSVSLWYNTGSNNRQIAGKWDDGTNCSWYWGFDSARPKLWVSGDGSNGPTGANVQSIRTGSNYTSGIWQHVVFTFNAGTMNVYGNGALDNGTTAGTPQGSVYSGGSQPLEMGLLAGGNPGSDSSFIGFIDEYSFWSVALTLSEVGEIYNGGAPNDLSSHSQSANLEEWVRMGENATISGLPELTSIGALTLDYANGMSISDVSTNVAP